MPDTSDGVNAKKPQKPPQKAGQKRKDASEHTTNSGNKRAKPNGIKGTPQQTKKDANAGQTKGGQSTGAKASNITNNGVKKGTGQNQTQQQNGKRGPKGKGQTRQLDARMLATQTTSKAFKNGELDVDRFVKAREFEIQALQDGLQRSKLGRHTRAFQQVPREMRRRAGAWNVKLLPKRKREQAMRQITEDKTPTGSARRKKLTRNMRLRLETVKKLRTLGAKRKAAELNSEEVIVTLPKVQAGSDASTRAVKSKRNALKDAPVVKAKFRKRQMHKTWLPTHIWHAKRAHMSPAMQPVWRFAMPLSPTAKSYRPTHRAASTRGAVAWDVSYMATIGLEGVEASLLGVFTGMHAKMLEGVQRQLWLDGVRSWQGWVFSREDSNRMICPVTIIWRAEEQATTSTGDGHAAGATVPKPPRRKLMVRAHPSAFRQLWEEMLRVCKVQKPQVVAEDLRYELGSIEIIGAGSTEALHGALWPSLDEHGQLYDKDDSKAWQSLQGIDTPALLPPSVALAFKISDPRLHHPPRPVKSNIANDTLLKNIVALDARDRAAPQAIFDSRIRRASVSAMSSQGKINRRKAEAKAGEYPAPKQGDPSIPVLVYASSLASYPATAGKRTRSVSWTILLPWKAVLPVWHSIMYYPLSTSGQPRLGALDQQRQLAFEDNTPWWPGDFPGTTAGDEWIARDTEDRKKTWERRPPSRRVAFDTLDLGDTQKGELGSGWGMPFELLAAAAKSDGAGEADQIALRHLDRLRARSALNGTVTAMTSDLSLFTARITFLGRGTPKPCARIYALPFNDAAKLKLWTSLFPPSFLSPDQRPAKRPMNRQLPVNGRVDITELARQLMVGDEDEPKDHPAVPGETSLIGFVTSGAFNLHEGKGTGIASLGIDRVKQAWEGAKEERLRNICIVRNAGEKVGRLAVWEMV